MSEDVTAAQKGTSSFFACSQRYHGFCRGSFIFKKL